MSKRALFVAKCLEYHGFNEADSSHRIIVDLYNGIRPLPAGYRLSYLDPWCAGFVSAMAKQCGLLDMVYPECSCDRMIELYKKAGRWQERDDYTPQPGDLVFYDWQDSGKGDNAGSADHVGVVTSVSGLSIKVIEGNMSDAVGFRNLTVGARYIRGFACPDFEGEGKAAEDVPEKGTEPEAKPTAQSCSVTLPVLKRGSVGSSVRALQLLLIGAGHDVGPDGADGDFGYNTEQALKACQKKKSIEADGIAGEASWSALLK